MIVLQITLDTHPGREADLEARFADTFLPAIRPQEGFVSARLLRRYPPEMTEGTAMPPDGPTHQLELAFTSEEARRAWVRSPGHDRAWPVMSDLVASSAPAGFDLCASSDVSDDSGS